MEENGLKVNCAKMTTESGNEATMGLFDKGYNVNCVRNKHES